MTGLDKVGEEVSLYTVGSEVGSDTGTSVGAYVGVIDGFNEGDVEVIAVGKAEMAAGSVVGNWDITADGL